jgi:hypothetical protein
MSTKLNKYDNPHQDFIRMIELYSNHHHRRHFTTPYEHTIPNVFIMSRRIQLDESYKLYLTNLIIDTITQTHGSVVYTLDNGRSITPEILAEQGYMNYIRSPRYMFDYPKWFKV